ncbi:MAG: hypothetical protein IIC93_07235, partial [Chloroflexi bacterium]|nr:hypothetical protein [Chloroflexota bacterium]
RAQFLLFDSVATILQQFAAQRPLLIILEDIQWADKSTLAVLEHLATRPSDSNSNIGVVATHRPEGVESAVASTVSELRRSTGFVDIELRGLDSKSIERLISSVAGVTPSAESVDSIQKLTDGNPFFVREAVRWSGEGGPGSAAPTGGLPPVVQEVVLSRLQPLDQDVLGVLETASILGRDFELPRLIACLDTADRSQVLSALEAGIAHRVLNDVPGVPDLYRFEHEITRQALYHGIPGPRRSRMHAEIAERLETHYGAAAVEHATELSHHSYQAGSAGEAERLKAWALTAGERALAAFSYEFAIEQFERVVDPDRPGSIDHAEARALTGLGRALSQIREETKGVECLKKAFDFFMDSGQMDDAVEIASIHLIGQEGQLATISIKEAALDLLDENSVEAARIMASLARPVGVHQGNYERASGLLARALESARREGDAALEMRIAEYGIFVAWFNQKREEAEEWCRRVLALANEIDDPFALSTAHLHLSLIRFDEGAFPEADEHTRIAIQAGHDTRNEERISSVYKHRQSLAIRRCDWDLARASAARSSEYWADDPRTLVMSAATEFLTGNSEEGERILHAFRSLPTDQQDVEGANLRWLPVIARCSGKQTHRMWAKDAAKRAREASMAANNVSFQSAAQLALAWMAAEESDGAAATDLLDAIPEVEIPDPLIGAAPALAHAAGRLEAAHSEYERLIERFSGSGFTLAEAWLRYDFARFLTDNPSLKGSRATRRAVNAGMRMAAEFGLTPLVARFEALADQLTGSDARPFSLSRREAEILGMIATGMSNQEIADSLILSRHTVVRHVANVFAKLDVNNRTEAAAIALEYEIGVEAK